MKTKTDRLLGELDKQIVKSLPAHKKQEKEIQDDYEYSREVYKDLINTGMSSLDSLAELARESEHPRAFEVLSRSIKDIADTTDKLMSLQKNKKDLQKDEKAEEAKTVTNNNMFIGSTTDLQRMLLDNQEKNVIDHESENKE